MAEHHAEHAGHHAAKALGKHHKLDKKTLFIIGGGLLLVLVYMYYKSSQANSASSSTTPSGASNVNPSAPDTIGGTYDQAASDYASLAGDIQQSQVTEQTDVQRLQRALAKAMKQDKKLAHEFRKYRREHHHGGHHNHHHPKGTGGHHVGHRGHGPHHAGGGHSGRPHHHHRASGK